MHVSPATPSAAKTRRAKTKGASAASTSEKKNTRSRKKASAPPEPDPQIEVLALYPAPEEMTGMIATAAYFIAAERHFSPGHELDDWLEAERRVRAQFPSI